MLDRGSVNISTELPFTSTKRSILIDKVLKNFIPFKNTTMNELAKSVVMNGEDDGITEGFLENSTSLMNTSQYYGNETMGTTRLPFKAGMLQILQVVICLSIVFGNSLILAAIKKSNSLQSVIHYWMGNLAVADLFVGFSVGVRVTLELIQLSTELGCRLLFGVAIMSFGVSITGLFMASYETYKCIKSSIMKQSMLPWEKRMTILKILALWVAWGIFSVTGMMVPDPSIPPEEYETSCHGQNGYFNRTFLGISAGLIFIHFPLIAYTQFGIVMTVRAHTRAMLKQGVYGDVAKMASTRRKKKVQKETSAPSTGSQTEVTFTDISADGKSSSEIGTDGISNCAYSSSMNSVSFQVDTKFGKEEDQVNKNKTTASPTGENQQNQSTPIPYQIRMERQNLYKSWLDKIAKLSKLVTILLILLIVFWMPYEVFIFWYVTCSEPVCPNKTVLMITATMLFVTSLTNVFVYAIKNKDFRDEFRNILCGNCLREKPDGK